LRGAAFAEVIQGPGLDQRCHLFVEWLDTQEKIVQRGKRTAFAFVQKHLFGTIGKSFHLESGHANFAVADGELRSRFVDPGPPERDAQAMAFEDINERVIKAFAVGEHGGHEFSGIITLDPGGLIGLDAISRAVRFAKGIALETGHQGPDFSDFAFRPASRAGAGGEFVLNFGDDIGLVLGQRASEDVGAAGRQAGESLADLEDMLFVNDQAVGAAQARLEGRMRIMHGAEALVTARELHLFAFVGRAGANHRNDGDESVDVPRVAHFAERDHGRAFDVMHGAGMTVGDQTPDLGIGPGFQGVEIEDGGWRMEF
jgi:hypothetical protein